MLIIKIFLLILLCIIVWFVSAILSSLITKKFFSIQNKEYWAIIYTLFAPVVFIALIIILPFRIIYKVICYILEK